jgi:hypothetical protein
VFRDLFRRQPGSSNTNDNEKRNENDHIIHLDGVTVLEFESLLTFFYEGYGNVRCTTCSTLRVIIQISDILFSFQLAREFFNGHWELGRSPRHHPSIRIY